MGALTGVLAAGVLAAGVLAAGVLSAPVLAGTTPPGDPADGGGIDPVTGAGPSGSLAALPLCDAGTTIAEDLSSCAPLPEGTPGGVVALSTAASCPTQGELEGFFTEADQMRQFLGCFLPIVEGWIDLAWPKPELQHPNSYLYIPTGVSGGGGGTGFCEFDDQSYHYCLLDGNVYLGEQLVWTIYRDIGDTGPLVGLAHEAGHRFQHVAGMGRADPAVPNETVPTENQADCVSGVFLDYLARQGYLTPGDDMVDIAETLIFLGQLEEGYDVTERTHGGIDQRLRAFYVGYNDGWAEGIAACNGLVTDVALAA